jgi:DNA-binding PadR family transcriptional regulator
MNFGTFVPTTALTAVGAHSCPAAIAAKSLGETPHTLQATTRGTASQAIKTLEVGGYLIRQRSKADGRSVTLRLTDKGHEVVARDPFQVLVRAVGSLKPQEQTAMRNALHRVLTTLATSGTRQHFGVCRDCAHARGFVPDFGNLAETEGRPMSASAGGVSQDVTRRQPLRGFREREIF